MFLNRLQNEAYTAVIRLRQQVIVTPDKETVAKLTAAEKEWHLASQCIGIYATSPTNPLTLK